MNNKDKASQTLLNAVNSEPETLKDFSPLAFLPFLVLQEYRMSILEGNDHATALYNAIGWQIRVLQIGTGAPNMATEYQFQKVKEKVEPFIELYLSEKGLKKPDSESKN